MKLSPAFKLGPNLQVAKLPDATTCGQPLQAGHKVLVAGWYVCRKSPSPSYPPGVERDAYFWFRGRTGSSPGGTGEFPGAPGDDYLSGQLDGLSVVPGRMFRRQGSPTKLQEVMMEVVDVGECQKSLGGAVSQQQICALGQPGDSCKGDSGGPLVSASTKVLVGIVSWGAAHMQCGQAPGVYTAVCSYLSWITGQMRGTVGGAGTVGPVSGPCDDRNTIIGSR